MPDDGRVPAVDADGGDPDAVPGVVPEGRVDADASSFMLEVDGERFSVRTVVDDATGYADNDYTWLTGPNAGYGFGLGGPSTLSRGEHRQRIREFLAMVDPSTGFITGD